MQAYAEGFEIMHASDYELDLAQIAELWRQGSVVRSWLLELLGRAFERRARTSPHLKGWVADSGEGRWTVQEAIDHDVPAPVITLSLLTRFRSRQDDSYGGQGARRAAQRVRRPRGQDRASRATGEAIAWTSRRRSRALEAAGDGAVPEDLPAPRRARPDVRRRASPSCGRSPSGPKRDQALATRAVGDRQLRRAAPRLHGRRPGGRDRGELDAWLAEIDVYTLVDIFVASLASQVTRRPGPGGPWSAADRDWTSQAGWDLYAQLALNDPDLDDALLRGPPRPHRGRHRHRREPDPAQHERRPDRDRRPQPRSCARRPRRPAGGSGSWSSTTATPAASRPRPCRTSRRPGTGRRRSGTRPCAA